MISRTGSPKAFWFMSLLLLAIPVLSSAHNIRTSYEKSFIDPLVAELRVLPQPSIGSKSVLIFETTTGTILYQKNIDLIIPPASLTKLVVMALALEFLKSHSIPLDTIVTVRPESWAINAPSRSSLMFLGPRQTCSWQDLLLGLAVDSGNDAALAIAEAVSGNVETFVREMNAWCAHLGMESTHFVEPSGYDEHNISTARDFSYFIWDYLQRFPQAIELYHSVRQFTYPHESDQPGIRQSNRNKLLFDYPGADGLKTGFINESGYNLAFSAKRGNMRLAGIILGGVSEKERFNDARSLLDYSFNQYRVLQIARPAPLPIRIWNGSQPLLVLSAGSFAAVLPASMINGLKTTIKQSYEIEGPFDQTTVLAWANVADQTGRILLHMPISAGIDIGEANFIVQWAEKAYLGVRSLTGKPWPQKASKPGIN